MESIIKQVKEIYEAISKLPQESPCFENLTWVEMRGGPYGGVYNTPQEIRQGVFDRLGTEWEGFRFTPQAFLESADAVVVMGDYTGSYKSTGKQLKARVAHVWQRQNGKLLFEQLTDTALLRDAME